MVAKLNINRFTLELKTRQYFLKHVLRKRVGAAIFYAKGRENIGDSIVPWLTEKMSGKAFPYSNPREASGPHLFSIGSILQYADRDSVIWGSGLISSKSRPHSMPARILAVRGPLTRDRLVELGATNTGFYGDPAILVPKFISVQRQPERFKIGLIPHYVDKQYIEECAIWKSSSRLICDVETADIQKFINEVTSCDVVVSSSLHGIILSEAFGVPAIWAVLDDRVIGNGFKFYDYYLSTERNVQPVNFRSLTAEIFAKHIPPPPKNLEYLASGLLETFPNDL